MLVICYIHQFIITIDGIGMLNADLLYEGNNYVMKIQVKELCKDMLGNVNCLWWMK